MKASSLLLISLVSGFGQNCPLIDDNNLDGVRKSKPYTEKRSNRNTKIAFLGDQGLGVNAMHVLRMIKRWGADLVVNTGDFDYQDSPNAFMHQFTDTMGKKFPMMAVPGNHDIMEWFNEENGNIVLNQGYKKLLQKQQVASKLNKRCVGELGINQFCLNENQIFVLSGVGTLGVGHAQFIDETLTKHQKIPWKFCVWHKNQREFQTGDKFDETGYQVYETCRKHGAIVITSHEHSYERTHLMKDFSNQIIASKSSVLKIVPGVSFAAVTGLGGDSIRPWKDNRNLNPWWAATVSSSNNGKYGALLCNLKRKRGFCEFRDINGTVWDSFNIDVSLNGGVLPLAMNSIKKDTHEIPLSSQEDISGEIVEVGKTRLIQFGNFNQQVEESLLTFHFNLPFDIHVTDASLQFMIHSPGKASAKGKVKIRVVHNSALKIQNRGNLGKLFADQIEEFEHGGMWITSDLKQILNHELLRGKGQITFAVSGQTDISGVFGFVASHTELTTCLSPTFVLSLGNSLNQ